MHFHWEDQAVGGWIILKMVVREIACGDMDWIELAQAWDRWRDCTENAGKLLNSCTACGF
jgi:hypothetical protein